MHAATGYYTARRAVNDRRAAAGIRRRHIGGTEIAAGDARGVATDVLIGRALGEDRRSMIHQPDEHLAADVRVLAEIIRLISDNARAHTVRERAGAWIGRLDQRAAYVRRAAIIRRGHGRQANRYRRFIHGA